MEAAKGLIFNIQRYSVHDGSGIRSNVFFKGCPLSCQWCANPESQNFFPELVVTEKDCIQCGTCFRICPTGALSEVEWSRNLCNACEKCVSVCPTAARTFVGAPMTVKEIKNEIVKDAGFYHTSGGGITLTGGEALSQAEFAAELSRELKKDYYTLAIETSGFAPWEKACMVFQYMDEILYDIKHMDSRKHEALTGVPNTLILENAKMAAKLPAKFVVRVPVIGGKNNDEENMEKTGAFAKEIGADEIDLLPYHRFGENKYKKLGREYDCDAYVPDDAEMERWKRLMTGMGLNCHIGG